MGFIIGLFILWASLSGVSFANQPMPEVSGRLGLDCSTGNGYLAILVDIPEGQALSGLMWYNNDSGSVFPRILAGTGYSDQPPPLVEFVTLADSVYGASDGWSEVDFDLPVGASLGALHLVFEFPDGEFTGSGLGGGPAVGYLTGSEGSVGWASADGDEWSPLHLDYRFAVIPKLVPFTEGMLVKSLGDDEDNSQPDPGSVLKSYLTAGPNPFNPKVEIKFGLTTGGDVSMDVFDIRGARVRQLVKGPLEEGRHSVVWLGKDDHDRQVASGAYFVRLKTPSKVLTQRLMLVR